MNNNTPQGVQVDFAQFQESILNSLSDGVYFVDRDRRILFWNKACEEMTGYTAEEVIGTSCKDGILMHVNHKGVLLCKSGCPLTATMTCGKSVCAHVFMHHKDGHRVPVHVRGAPIRDKFGTIIGASEIFSDDTERQGTMDRVRELEKTALIDELTGLANRRYFNRSLSASLAEFSRTGTSFGIVMLDIDNFKLFNDTYGHEVGDAVLKMVAATLGSNCRSQDTPTRWGGEEFAIISRNISAETLLIVSERLRVLVSQSSYHHHDDLLSVTISLGVTMVQEGDDAASIVKRVDSNLYKSKESGRNQITTDFSCTDQCKENVA